MSTLSDKTTAPIYIAMLIVIIAIVARIAFVDDLQYMDELIKQWFIDFFTMEI